MKLRLGRCDTLKPARRFTDGRQVRAVSSAPLNQKREAMYRAIEQTQAFMHKRTPTDAFMERLRRRYPTPVFFVESSRKALERAGVPRLDAFYYALIPALTRTCMSQQWGMHPRLDNLDAMGEYLKTLYLGVHVECFYLVLLNRMGKLIRPVLLQRGGVDNAPFYLRQLLSAALEEQAREAFAPLRIPLLDHIIIAGEAVVSIRQIGLLPNMLWTAAQPGSKIVNGWLNAKNLN